MIQDSRFKVQDSRFKVQDFSENWRERNRFFTKMWAPELGSGQKSACFLSRTRFSIKFLILKIIDQNFYLFHLISVHIDFIHIDVQEKVQGLMFEIQDSRFEVQGSRFKI